MIPYAEVSEQVAEDRIVVGPGWRQVTPAGKKGRHYEDTAPACDIADATDEHFDSVTHLLRTGWATDFTGPTKANVAKFAWEHARRLADERVRHDGFVANGQTDQAELVRKDVTKKLRDSADVSLNEYADRGSAIHRALEALLKGHPLDRDDLARNGALPWLLAIQSFLIEAKPEPVELEVVCFDRKLRTAGTADFVGYLRGIPEIADLLCVDDYKTRTSGHDRRQKEAVQGGAYGTMLTDGYYMDGRGRRQRMEHLDGALIITFEPGGTWRWHKTDLEASKRAYQVAAEAARLNRVSVLFPERSKDHGPFDVNAVALQRIAVIPEGSTELPWLADQWVSRCLPSASMGELTYNHWPEVDWLLSIAEEPYKQFSQAPERPVEYVSTEAAGALLARLNALPDDLREQVDRAGASLPNPGAGMVTVEEAEDWGRALKPAEEAVEARMSEALELLHQIRVEFDDDMHLLVCEILAVDGGAAAWKDADFVAAEALILAVQAGHLVVDPDVTMLAPSPASLEAMGDEGKRPVVAKAKELHETYGRPKPTKWADLVADPILWAAVSTSVDAAV